MVVVGEDEGGVTQRGGMRGGCVLRTMPGAVSMFTAEGEYFFASWETKEDKRWSVLNLRKKRRKA